MLETVKKTIEQYAMLEPGARMLVACSGGADSVGLAQALHALGYAVELAHLDHGTRQGASGEDAAFVASFGASLGVPVHTERQAVAEMAAETGRSFELAARAARYAFFRRVARAREIGVVATGHHADDQAETVLMRVLRGAGLRGLGGISPVRDDAAEGACLRIVRPLLRCSRAEILAYLVESGLTYREDASNTHGDYTRNRVRHDLLPLLRDTFNPNVAEQLTRLAELARTEDAFLAEQAAGLYRQCVREDELERAAFRALPLAMQRRVMGMYLAAAGAAPSFERIEEARSATLAAETGAACDLGRGRRLYVNREVVELLCCKDTKECRDAAPLECPGVTEVRGVRYEIVERQGPAAGDLAAYCSPARQVFDARAFSGRVALRTRRPGDRFTPWGMRGSKKVKDYLIGLGMPMGRRMRQPLLVVDDRIVWVVGHAISAQAAVTPETKRTIEVRVSDAAK